jgi:hypothetical protein
MAKTRVYLFHGNDTRASLAEVSRWRRAFVAKYDGAGAVVIDSDEAEVRSILGRLQESLTTHNLFAEPRFTVLRRSASLTPAQQKELVAFLSTTMKGLVEGSVLVIWEDRLLKEAAPLLKWAQDKAEIKEYQVVDARHFVDRTVKTGRYLLTPDAQRWAVNWCRNVEKAQRVEGRLKATERIAADRRSWELPTLFDMAALLIPETRPIDVKDLEQALTTAEQPVSPFEIINATQAEAWSKAIQLSQHFGEGDERAYYGLAALLRMHFSRELNGRHPDLAQYALQLLAEIELVSKNVAVHLPWLFDVFFQRCAQHKAHGSQPLLSPRRLWLSHVQRMS